MDVFKEVLWSYYEEREETSKELKQEIEELIRSLDDNEIRAYDAASDFRWKGDFYFTDLWEHRFTEFTYRYLWCCYGIVYGIHWYNESKKNTDPGIVGWNTVES